QQAVPPTPKARSVTGVVWRDFSPGGGTPGKVEQGELGIPGARVDLLDSSGRRVQSTKTEANGSFEFNRVRGSGLKTEIDPATFGAPFPGGSGGAPRRVRAVCVFLLLQG